MMLSWFSLRNATHSEKGGEDADEETALSDMLADGWEDVMTAVIESGDGCSKSSKF